MRTLVIDRRDARLSVEAGRIRIELPDAPRPSFVPVSIVERVIVLARATLDTALLGALGEAGAGVLVLSPRDHRRVALFLPPMGKDARARLALYAAFRRDDFRLDFARRVVRAKLAAQQRMLAGLPATLAVRGARRALAQARRTAREATSLETLRAIEGGTTRAYFAALASALPASLRFDGRSRRPPRDPVNALLSLTYTLLHFDAVRAAHAAALDPMVGFYHELEHGRESLACDLIEPLRADADRFVLDLFRRRVVRVEDFGDQQGACRLNKAGRGRFYAAWDERARGWRRRLRRLAGMVKKAVIAADAQ